ncbi:hypothetical protein DICVIV_08436 [Dictyocaulus viviparus]|uniref:Uncharacterized protein n=1 Tax=Dictyocaulus viviparus TaxID=29172 RepID=A0A0D8XNY9_DICVI|nr:hypothetical protein DICVIV_08436 [Dictyocaulus viviparus]
MIRANEKKSVALLSHKRVPSSSLSTTPDRALKDDCEEFQKENYCDREFTTFFFDEEMHLLANEVARSDCRYRSMSYDKLSSPGKKVNVKIPVMEDEPIRNYEDLVPGRHRRSGNERVHPNNLYTAFSRSKNKLERELPLWIDADLTEKNDELKYWRDHIDYVYHNLHTDCAFRDNGVAGVEQFHSETELDSSAGSAPSQEELCDFGDEIFGFSDRDSDLD